MTLSGDSVYEQGTITAAGATVTLEDGSWPDNLPGSKLTINGIGYDVSERVSDTELTTKTTIENLSTPTNYSLTIPLKWPNNSSDAELTIDGRAHKVASRNSDTELELVNKSVNADAGSSYKLKLPLYWLTPSEKPFIEYGDVYQEGAIKVATGTVTLTGGSWPNNLSGSKLTINDIEYEVSERVSDTELTITNTAVVHSTPTNYSLALSDEYPQLDAQDDFVKLKNGDGQAYMATYGERVVDLPDDLVDADPQNNDKLSKVYTVNHFDGEAAVYLGQEPVLLPSGLPARYSQDSPRIAIGGERIYDETGKVKEPHTPAQVYPFLLQGTNATLTQQEVTFNGATLTQHEVTFSGSPNLSFNPDNDPYLIYLTDLPSGTRGIGEISSKTTHSVTIDNFFKDNFSTNGTVKGVTSSSTFEGSDSLLQADGFYKDWQLWFTDGNLKDERRTVTAYQGGEFIFETAFSRMPDIGDKISIEPKDNLSWAIGVHRRGPNGFMFFKGEDSENDVLGEIVTHLPGEVMLNLDRTPKTYKTLSGSTATKDSAQGRFTIQLYPQCCSTKCISG